MHFKNITNLSIIGIAGLAFCGVLVETSMNVTFPTLMRDFHQSLNAVQWVTTGYLLTPQTGLLKSASTSESQNINTKTAATEKTRSILST